MIHRFSRQQSKYQVVRSTMHSNQGDPVRSSHQQWPSDMELMTPVEPDTQNIDANRGDMNYDQFNKEMTQVLDYIQANRISNKEAVGNVPPNSTLTDGTANQNLKPPLARSIPKLRGCAQVSTFSAYDKV